MHDGAEVLRTELLNFTELFDGESSYTTYPYVFSYDFVAVQTSHVSFSNE